MNLPSESPKKQRHRAEYAAGPEHQCARTAPDTVEVNLRQSDWGSIRRRWIQLTLRRCPHAVGRGGLQVAILSGRAFGRAASLIVSSQAAVFAVRFGDRRLAVAINSPNGGWVRAISVVPGCQCGLLPASHWSLRTAGNKIAAGVGHYALAVVGDPSGAGQRTRRSRGQSSLTFLGGWLLELEPSEPPSLLRPQRAAVQAAYRRLRHPGYRWSSGRQSCSACFGG